MVSPPHNPNRVDLGKDVLFELIPPAYARTARRRIDAGVWKPLDAAVGLFRQKAGEAARSGNEAAERLFKDQAVRMEALRCHYRTLRNAAVWIEDVHGYLGARNARAKDKYLKDLRAMIDDEIRNTRAMIRLWKEARPVWMMVSEIGETPFIYGANFAELLEKKIALMKRHRLDRPWIDPDYMFRFAGNPYRSE